MKTKCTQNLLVTALVGAMALGIATACATDPLPSCKLTGVILPSGTVSIQYHEPSEERIFFTGKLTRLCGTLQIVGDFHFFDDFQHYHEPYAEGGKMMASGLVRLTKVE